MVGGGGGEGEGGGERKRERSIHINVHNVLGSISLIYPGLEVDFWC